MNLRRWRRTTTRSNSLLVVAILLIWSCASSSPLHRSQAQSPSATYAIAWSPEGERLATGYADGSVTIWDMNSGQVLHILRGHSDRVVRLSWKPDGSQLMSGSNDGTACVWDTASGQLLAVLADISPTLTLGVAWTPDGSKIITYGADTNPSFRIWDAATYQQIYAGIGGDVVELVFNPDGSRAALANAAGQLLVSDPTTFETLLKFDEPPSLEGGTFGVYAAAWHPNGNQVAGGNFAGDVRLWNIVTGENIYNLRATDSVQLDRTVTLVRALHFSSDGLELSSITADGTFRTWDTRSGQIIHTELLNNSPIFAAAWSPDGTQIAYGGESRVPSIVAMPH